MKIEPNEKSITEQEASKIWDAVEYLQEILTQEGTLNIKEDKEEEKS